ncbi:MAG TPA: DNA recombination protein RmuC, partial [Verrucomicrobiales bacterium]|nr:DNA recombination protein RmuC [Verrucomicrobiales bacterium]
DARTAAATAEAQRMAAEKLVVEQKALHDKALADARTAQDKAIADLKESFKALSADALKQTHPEFVRLANETFQKFQETAKGDLSQRQEAIKGLVEPLKQQLENYQRRLQQSETNQAESIGNLRKHLEQLAQHSQSLAQETLQFRMVLRSNQARGRWGEETLRRVVEAAGMSAHCDFTEQTVAGDAKPDLVVRLPGDRIIIVDSKVPDLDFLGAIDAADEVKRRDALAAHASKLRQTIKGLADRDYPKQFANSLDYVVLFLPAESLFSAALEGDQELIVWAAQRKILLATPASLIALLRSVSVSWQQHAQTENARQIADAARELYERVATFASHFSSVRDGLQKAGDAFNKALASYESRVRPSGEKLQKLGVEDASKEIPVIEQLDQPLRLPPTQ